MLIGYSDAHEGYARMWKCIGCGREVLCDAERQREDERLLAQLKMVAAD
jgi:hypothetical protein